MRLALSLHFFALLALCQTVDPAQLVKDAAANEVQATEHPSDFWMYRLSKESKSGAQVKDMVETKDGIVARLVSLNGRPLTDSERSADETRLNNLQQNPEEQAHKRDEQKKEQDRFLSLVRALPKALIYADDGTEQIEGRQAVRLKFRPSPSFRSMAKETIIFRECEGHIWIDPLEKRVVMFDGTTTNDINIGFGILGHIDKGSSLHLEQRRLGDNKWRLSALALDGNGKILFFKSISLKQRQKAMDFQPVPAGLSLSEGIALLRKQSATMAREILP